MHNIFAVRGIKRVRNLNGEIQQFLSRNWSCADSALKSLPFKQLHRDEGLAIVLADFVDGADVGMVQSRGGSCFPPKAFERLWVSGYVLRQEFQGDEATEFSVLGLVHDTHATTAE